jgi:DNA-binding NarL/FixJ family response regulator
MGALRLVLRHQEELKAVITDLHMPNMDGEALAMELRKVAPNVGIVVMSGNFVSAKVQELKALGVSAFLDKPFTQGMLAAALETVVHGVK